MSEIGLDSLGTVRGPGSCSTGRPVRRSPPVARAPSCSRGRMNGIGAAPISRWSFADRRRWPSRALAAVRRPCELPLPKDMAAHLGRRVHLQRVSHHRRVPGGFSTSSIRTSSVVVDEGPPTIRRHREEYGFRMIRTPNRDSAAPATRGWPRPPARSSPTSTTTRIRIPTGSPI